MARIPDTLVAVDRQLLGLSYGIQPALTDLRARLAQAQANPITPASEIAHLHTAIDELERALGRIRYQPSGEYTEPQAQPAALPQVPAPAPAAPARKAFVLDLRKAARAPGGQFARHGGAAHFAAARRDYHGKRKTGEIDGTREDWRRHLRTWKTDKDKHQIDLLGRLRHYEADARALEPGPELAAVQKKIERLQRRLQALGVSV